VMPLVQRAVHGRRLPPTYSTGCFGPGRIGQIVGGWPVAPVGLGWPTALERGQLLAGVIEQGALERSRAEQAAGDVSPRWRPAGAGVGHPRNTPAIR